MNKAVAAMNGTPRCGARTRSGAPCKGPAVGHQGRCRMHRGGKAKGAPLGNHHAMRHGLYGKRAQSLRKEMRTLVQFIRAGMRTDQY